MDKNIVSFGFVQRQKKNVYGECENKEMFWNNNSIEIVLTYYVERKISFVPTRDGVCFNKFTRAS